MRAEWERWRLATFVGLGAIAFVVMPLSDSASLVTWSLLARGIATGCVVGLLFAEQRGGWVVPAISAVSAYFGFVALVLVDVRFSDPLGLGIGVLSAAAVGWGIATLGAKTPRRAAEVCALATVLMVAVWLAGVVPTPSQVAPAAARQSMLSRVPQPETYSFDGDIYLRTYYLMKNGVGYYEAFRQSVIDDTRHDASFLTSPLNFREPLVFELWRVLPGKSGYDAFLWFVVWSLATMIAAYLLASRLAGPGAALLAPIALTRFFYFFWWADRSWFTTTEVWAAGLGVAAVAALLRERRVTSLALLVAAVATRELMVVFIPCWLVAWWFADRGSRRATWWFPTVAVAGPLAALAAHVLSVPKLAVGGDGVAAWLHGGPVPLVDALGFGWSTIAHGAAWLPFAIVVSAIAAAALARPMWRLATLFCATVVPVLFLLAFSGGVPWLYWGAFYTPLAAAVAPGVFGRLVPPWADTAGTVAASALEATSTSVEQ